MLSSYKSERGEEDSNLRGALTPTVLAGPHHKPLGHRRNKVTIHIPNRLTQLVNRIVIFYLKCDNIIYKTHFSITIMS